MTRGVDVSVTTAQNLRDRLRVELRQEMVDLAREQLRVGGVEGLSLRGIARDLEMAPSAVHRYFESREDLITTLIVDSFNALGEAVELADEAHADEEPLGRWIAATAAVRDWAQANPHRYALIYGSPIPGYVAPENTAVPAARDKVVLGRILVDARRTGKLHPPAVPPAVAVDAADGDRLRAVVLPDFSDDLIATTLTAWAGIHGFVSLEVFGHFNNMVMNTSVVFDNAVLTYGRLLGLGGLPS